MSTQEPATTSDEGGSLPCSRRDIGRTTVAAAATLIAAKPVSAAGGPYKVKMEADIPSSTGISLTIKCAAPDGSIKDSVSIGETTINSGMTDGVFTKELSSLNYAVGDRLWIDGSFSVDTTKGLYPVIHNLEFANNIEVQSGLLEVDAVIPEDASATIQLYSSDRKLDEPFNEINISNGMNAYEIRDEWITESADIWVEGSFSFGQGATEDQKRRVGIKNIRLVEIGKDPTGSLNVTVSQETIDNTKLDLGPELPTIGSSDSVLKGVGNRGLNFTMSTAKYLAFIGLIGGGSVWVLDSNENRSAYAYTVFKFALLTIMLYIGFETVVRVMKFIGSGMGQGL